MGGVKDQPDPPSEDPPEPVSWISQNRADAKRQVVADQQWATVQDEDKQNQELLDLSRQILDLTKQLHAFEARRSAGGPPQRSGSPS